MANRGFYGFVIDGTEKIGYEHDWSEPKGLGMRMLRWLKDELADVDALRTRVQALRVVTAADLPTPEEIERLARWTDLSVSKRSTQDWYCLLRHTQGHPAATLAAGIVLDATAFVIDGVWVDWGYLVDLDTGMFEVYHGGKLRDTTQGRFAHRPQPAASGDLWTSGLMRSWPLDALPTGRSFSAGLRGMRTKQINASKAPVRVS